MSFYEAPKSLHATKYLWTYAALYATDMKPIV